MEPLNRYQYPGCPDGYHKTALRRQSIKWPCLTVWIGHKRLEKIPQVLNSLQYRQNSRALRRWTPGTFSKITVCRSGQNCPIDSINTPIVQGYWMYLTVLAFILGRHHSGWNASRTLGDLRRPSNDSESHTLRTNFVHPRPFCPWKRQTMVTQRCYKFRGIIHPLFFSIHCSFGLQRDGGDSITKNGDALILAGQLAAWAVISQQGFRAWTGNGPKSIFFAAFVGRTS
jgi:hypothetical protein